MGFLLPRTSTIKIGIAALVFSLAIEFSQLYQSTWINQIRHTTFGGLILGFGFLWTDVICYIIGIILGMVIETYIHHLTYDESQ